MTKMTAATTRTTTTITIRPNHFRSRVRKIDIKWHVYDTRTRNEQQQQRKQKMCCARQCMKWEYISTGAVWHLTLDVELSCLSVLHIRLHSLSFDPGLVFFVDVTHSPPTGVPRLRFTKRIQRARRTHTQKPKKMNSKDDLEMMDKMPWTKRGKKVHSIKWTNAVHTASRSVSSKYDEVSL